MIEVRDVVQIYKSLEHSSRARGGGYPFVFGTILLLFTPDGAERNHNKPSSSDRKIISKAKQK